MSFETLNFDEYAVNREKFNNLPVTYGILVHEIVLRLYAYACKADPIPYKGSDCYKVNMTEKLKDSFYFYSSLGASDDRIGFVTKDFVYAFNNGWESYTEKEFESLAGKATREEDGYFISISKYINLVLVVKEKEEGDKRIFEEISFYIHKPNNLKISLLKV
jgi:hypothetical protein